MSTLAPYPAYRDVGQRWLDRIPETWSTSRMRYLCEIGTGSGDTIDAEPDGEYPFIVRSDTPLRARTYEFDCEAILTAGDGGVGEVFHHIHGKFLAHQRVYVLRNFQGIDTRFFFYYFSSHFRQMAQDGSARTTVDSVRRWMLTDMPFVVPPLGEQRAIADFLDRETGQIDRLIEKQEQLIDTLRERRAAVVAHAVTRGLDPRAPLKETHVAWLGEVPAHWELRPLWSMFERIKDVDHPDEPMLSVFRDHGVVYKDSMANLNVTADNRSIYQLVHPGWLVSNRMKAWQGSVGISRLRGIVSGHYICFAPRHNEHDAYLNYLFRSPRYAAGYRLISRGVRIGQAEIDNDDYRVLPVLVPPLEEQRAIAARLDEQTGRIDVLIERAERFIGLARERRAALVSAAVTGRIDVRGAV